MPAISLNNCYPESELFSLLGMEGLCFGRLEMIGDSSITVKNKSTAEKTTWRSEGVAFLFEVGIWGRVAAAKLSEPRCCDKSEEGNGKVRTSSSWCLLTVEDSGREV